MSQEGVETGATDGAVTLHDVARRRACRLDGLARAVEPERVNVRTREHVQAIARGAGLPAQPDRTGAAHRAHRDAGGAGPDITNPHNFGLVRGARRRRGPPAPRS